MKHFIVFLAFILNCTTVTHANSQLIMAEAPAVCADDDIIIVVIQPRSDNTHDIEIKNLIGQGVLTITSSQKEIVFNQVIDVPTIKNINTSNYPSGTYLVEFTFGGTIYAATFDIE